MEDVKGLQLFREIVAKTRAGRIKWEATARESEYISILPGEFVVSIATWLEGGDVFEVTALTLKAGDQEILRVTPDVDGVELSDLRDLQELARRHALGVNIQVDRLLGELAKL